MMVLPKLKIIDRYTITELVKFFGTGMLVVGTVMILTKVDLIVKLITSTSRPLTVIEIISLIFISSLNIVIPTAFLIGVVSTFLKLSSDTELIAINSLGIPTLRAIKTVIVIALIVSVISLIVNLYLIPLSNKALKGLSTYAVIKRKNFGVEPYKFNEITNNIVIYLEELSDNTIHNLVMFDKKDKGKIIVINAEEGQIKASESGKLKFKLKNGNMIVKNINSVSIIDFRNYNIDMSLDISEKFKKPTKKELLFNELLKREKEITEKRELLNLALHKHKRISLAFSPIFLSLAAIPISIKVHRREKKWSILIPAIMMLLYFSIFSISQKIGLRINSPLIGSWLPNIIFGILGTLLILTKIDRPNG